MKKISAIFAKILCFFLGLMSILLGISGIIACTFSKSIASLVLCVIFTIIVFFIGITLFYVATKKISSSNYNAKTKERHGWNGKEYEKIILPNGNTIKEQQQFDYAIASGKYPQGTPEYLGMKIVSSTVPHQENYNLLNSMEKKFFSSFYNQITSANLSPSRIKLTRMSNGSFNVDYIGVCYVGKINLYEPPKTYAVIKNGNIRATKVFNSFQEAKEFTDSRLEYTIEERCGKKNIHMQYLRGSFSVKNLYGTSLEECIEHIPYWIRYIKYCIRN